MKWHGFLLLSLLLNPSNFVEAQEGEYAVSHIAPHLLKNANAVLRTQDIRFEIKNTRETTRHVHYVVTILNENGERWAEFLEYYDRYNTIDAMEGGLYDGNGKLLKKIRKRDLQDLDAASRGALAEDNRARRYKFFYKVYPYTVEYRFRITSKQTLFFPTWLPRAGEGISVANSRFSVLSPNGYRFRHKAFNCPDDPVVEGNMSSWTVKDLPAVRSEALSPAWHEFNPMVILGPSDFQVDNYKGNMSSWQDFGRFVYTLNIGRDQLPASIQQVVRSIADSSLSQKEKVLRLYEFLQRNTRYVSIQLGIGGWRPYDAKYVATNGYGDCKALTNYMYSLLKEAGINSYYALVRAGRNENFITADFPSQQFNHVILCVPLPGDTIWLECTSQTLQAGQLDELTTDRYSLLVDANGGRLVRTPAYGLDVNRRTRKIDASLTPDNGLQVITRADYSGLELEEIYGMGNHLPNDRMRALLTAKFDFPGFRLERFDYQQHMNDVPIITETLAIFIENFASLTGRRLFFVPNIMSQSHQRYENDTSRRNDIMTGYPAVSLDSVIIELPVGYVSEEMPNDIHLDTPFGSYHASIRLSGNKLIYHRQLKRNGGRYTAAQWNEFVSFYEAIYRADRSRVVLVRSE